MGSGLLAGYNVEIWIEEKETEPPLAEVEQRVSAETMINLLIT